MIEILLEPFSYDYMTRAIWVSAMVGGVCAFLSCYLMLKGWSLMGDALAHSVVPGVAISYFLGWPFAIGAFIAGGLAALSMAFVSHISRLREDAIIGLVFTAFLASGLVFISINPASVNITSIFIGNILAITNAEVIQVVLICTISALVLGLKWKDFMLIFFDENQARSFGLPVTITKIIFFTLLSACTVAALQTVGACLVIAMVVTPGATAYLLTDRFERLIIISVSIGSLISGFGAYISFFLDAEPGGLIVCLQALCFLIVFLFAPKHGILKFKGA